MYSEKFVQQAHEETLRGRVSLTTAKVRENHWVTRLRKLAKRLIKNCHGCKRFQTMHRRSQSTTWVAPKGSNGNKHSLPSGGGSIQSRQSSLVKTVRGHGLTSKRSSEKIHWKKSFDVYRILRSPVGCRGSSKQPALSYFEDDIQMPLITPENMMRLQSKTKFGPLRKIAKYLKRCKDAMLKRCRNEYLRGLREQER